MSRLSVYVLLLLAIVKRARADRGVVAKESPVGVKQGLHW